MQTVIAHRYYWQRVRKVEDNIPKLRFGIINPHPSKQEYPPFDYDGVIDRKNDIIFHDRTKFDENVALVGDSKLILSALLPLLDSCSLSH